MKKRLIALVSVLLVLILAAVPVFAAAEDVPFDTMVADWADLLTDSEEAALHERAWQLTQQYGCAVYIVTVDSMEGMEPWQYSEFIFDECGMGYGAERSCIMLMLSMEYRDYDIMAHGYGNYAFTDFGKEVMADRFLSDFGEDDWYGGFDWYLYSCEEFLQMAAEGTPYDVDTAVSAADMLLLTVPVGLLTALIVCAVFKAQMKTARRQQTAGGYVTQEGLVLTDAADIYIRTTRRVERIERSSSGGGGGGTTVNSHGSSHSSGKF